MLAEGTTSGGKELEPVRRCGAPSTRHSFVRRELIRKQGHIVLMYMLRFVPQQCSARSKIFRVTPNPRVQNSEAGTAVQVGRENYSSVTLPAAALSSDIVHSFVIATVGCL